MQMIDSLTLDASGLSLTRDGFLIGDAKVSRAGNVQMYRGSEIGLTGDEAGRIIGVYRDPDVVFDEKSMLSLAGRPVTRGHPQGGVTADNWKELAKGQIGGVIRRDGEHVVAPMAIMDAAAAKEIMDGARSLSAGYMCDIIEDSGIAPDGAPYQYRQAGSLRFNHVAYLPDNNPRAGNTRIGDSADASWGASPINLDRKATDMADAIMRTVLVDGLSVVTTDQGAQALEKLTKTIADQAKTLADAKDLNDKALAAKDAELAAKDAEIAKLNAAAMTDAALDKLVADRASLITKAKAIAPALVTDGKSASEIRKAAVVAKAGAAMADKSEAYLDAMFDILADAKPSDPVKAALADGAGKQTGVTDHYADYDKRTADAWKPKTKEAV